MTDVGNVTRGVSRDIEHVEAQAQGDEVNLIAAAAWDGVAGERGALPGRSEHRDGMTGKECLDPAGMITVMVGQQDGSEGQPVPQECLLDRGSIARIDRHDLAGGVPEAMDQPEIVVLEGRNSRDVESLQALD